MRVCLLDCGLGTQGRVLPAARRCVLAAMMMMELNCRDVCCGVLTFWNMCFLVQRCPSCEVEMQFFLIPFFLLLATHPRTLCTRNELEQASTHPLTQGWTHDQAEKPRDSRKRKVRIEAALLAQEQMVRELNHALLLQNSVGRPQEACGRCPQACRCTCPSSTSLSTLRQRLSASACLPNLQGHTVRRATSGIPGDTRKASSHHGETRCIASTLRRGDCLQPPALVNSSVDSLQSGPSPVFSSHLVHVRHRNL
jgi:hypothetical protein